MKKRGRAIGLPFRTVNYSILSALCKYNIKKWFFEPLSED